jgi:DNA-directed RNA polymerase specialized sigma24 family protein
VRLLELERHRVLARAFATLPDRHRRLMTLIAGDAGYEQIETTLDMPMGSIGPIRSRCLVRLQRHPELRELAETG